MPSLPLACETSSVVSRVLQQGLTADTSGATPWLTGRLAPVHPPASQAPPAGGTVSGEMPLPEISAEHLRFVEEYIKDRNIVRAALAAELSSTYQAAAEHGRQLLKKPEIRAWVRYVFNAQARRLKTAVPDVVREWAILGKSDLDDYVVGPDGRLTTAPGVPRSAMRAVKKFKQTRTERLSGDSLTVETRTELELHDKGGPLRALYDHLHGPLPGESADGRIPAADILGQVAAEVLAAQSESGAAGGTAGQAEGGAAVDPEAGSAGAGLPQPG